MGSLSHTPPPHKAVAGGAVTRRRAAAALFAPMLVLLIIIQASAVSGQNINTYAPPPDTNPYYGQQKFNPSMAIIMVILVGAFFVMGFLSVYVRQCNSRRRFRLDGEVSLGEGSFFFGRRSLRRATRGIDFTVIETFPTIEYSSVKGLKIGRGSLECAVCLNEFEDNDMLRLLPRCNHVFHSNCIDVWLSSHTTCPVCRDNLVPKPGEKFEPLVFDVGAGQEPILPTRTTSDQVNVHIEIEHNTNLETKPSLLDDRMQPSGKNTVPPRSRSTGMQTLARLFPFPRSHSTGHDSLVQPGMDHERFTLRLPDNVRDEIMRNASLKRTKSSAPAFPRAKSARTGFRRSTRGRSYFEYERFDHQDDQTSRRGCSMSMIPSILGRAGSVRSAMNEDVGTAPPSSRPERSIPFDGLFVRKDRDDGERSCDRLRPPVDQV